MFVIVGLSWALTYDPNGAMQCFTKSSLRPRTILCREYCSETPAAAGKLLSQRMAKYTRWMTTCWERVVGVREIQYEGSAPFFYGADESFDLPDVLAGGGGVNFHKIDFVLNFVKFLVHHDHSDDETSVSIKPDYFS